MIVQDKPLIIGETAFHHQGDKEFLKQLIDAAADNGIEVIKFHLLFDLDDYMVGDHQARQVLAGLCIPQQDWEEVFSKAVGAGLKIVFLCNDVASLSWVLGLNHPAVIAIEIHATGINDIFLLEKAAAFKGTVILGTGGSTIEEINFAVSFLRKNGQYDIFLMHGFQNYPTNYRDIVLSKMKVLADLFRLPVGYADHTDPADPLNEIISCLGVAMGFNVIEKHFTTAPGEKRIDGQSAVSLEQMTKIKALAENIWLARNPDALMMSAGEEKYGDTGPMKKAIVARKRIEKGEIIDKSMIAFKRTNASSYVKQSSASLILGQKTLKDIGKDEIIDFSKIEFAFKLGDFSQFNNSSK